MPGHAQHFVVLPFIVTIATGFDHGVSLQAPTCGTVYRTGHVITTLSTDRPSTRCRGDRRRIGRLCSRADGARRRGGCRDRRPRAAGGTLYLAWLYADQDDPSLRRNHGADE